MIYSDRHVPPHEGESEGEGVRAKVSGLAFCLMADILYRHPWAVYAKTPLGGSAQVLEYLSRYTHRTAISNERIVALTKQAVVLSVRADEPGSKRRVRLPGEESS